MKNKIKKKKTKFIVHNSDNLYLRLILMLYDFLVLQIIILPYIL